MKRCIPIAIDLGAKHTGVYFCELKQDNKEHFILSGKAVVVEMQDSSKIQWSQRSRTTRRHQKRRLIRRKLAKRLLTEICREVYGADPASLSQRDSEWLFGLMNRRGFTYLSDDELDMDQWGSADPDFLATILPPFFTRGSLPLEQLQRNTNDPNWIVGLERALQSLLRAHRTPGEKRQLDPVGAVVKSFLHQIGEEQNRHYESSCKNILRSLNKWLDTRLRDLREGHKPRRKYFDDIRTIMAACPLPESFFKNGLGKDLLAEIICHISNLQLRVLRRYYHGKRTPAWEPEKFHRIMSRWIHSWHAQKDTEDRANQILLRKFFRSTPPAETIRLFKEISPEQTIPPYEDMNNRRIPVCRSVILDSAALEKRYPHWRKWVNLLETEEADMAGELKYLDDEELTTAAALHRLEHADNNPHLLVSLTAKAGLHRHERDARVLQRFFDRSRPHDRFNLRSFTGEDNSARANASREILRFVIGSDMIDAFTDLVKHYYTEAAAARDGLWIADAPGNILRLCGRKPKMKKNQKVELLRQITGYRAEDDETVDEFVRYWQTAKVGRSTIRGIARLAYETIRKKGAARFKVELDEAERKEQLGGQVLNQNEIQLIDISDKSRKAAAVIGDHFGQLADDFVRYANPYSMAQLYGHLEKDSKGFSSVCPVCMQDNNWRMEMLPYSGPSGSGSSARCTRLTADAVRPFDGQLAMILDRLSSEISKKYENYLIDLSVNRQESIAVPLILEQNQFIFGDALKAYKISGKSQGDKDSAEFFPKLKRIKEAAKGVCAYTGKALGDAGEYDHIIPRSVSRDLFGTTLNSEANLIYVSQEGNQGKQNKLYTLDNLHPLYLTAQFGAMNMHAIQCRIEESFRHYKNLQREGRREFHRLDPELQRDLRHALFVPSLREDAISLLQTSIIARVNGTQAYLAKGLMARLCKAYPQADFRVVRIQPDDAQYERTRAARHNTDLAKKRPQGIASHALDAAFSLVSALNDPPTFRKAFPGVSLSLPQDNAAVCQNVVPESVEIISVERIPIYRKETMGDFGSSPIFKDGIFGERFLPILLDGNNLYLGFTRDNALKIETPHREAWFAALRPFLMRNRKPVAAGETAASLAASVGGACLRFSVDKREAFRFFERVYRDASPLGEDEQATLAILAGIRYGVVKQNVETIILPNQAKVSMTMAEILGNNKNFMINVEIPGLNKRIFGRKRAQTLLTAPFLQDWRRLLSGSDFVPLLGQKRAVVQGRLHDCLKAYFLGRGQHDTTHRRKARKVFSLPKLGKPSGGFRTRRQTPNGQPVYQMVAVNRFKVAGAPQNDDGTLNLQKEWAVMMPPLQLSNRLVPEDIKMQGANAIACYFDEWLDIDPPAGSGIERLMYALGSQKRFHCRVTMTTSRFFIYILPLANLIDVTTWLDLPASLKIQNGKAYEALFQKDETGDRLIIRPRSDLFFLEAVGGNTIQYRYITEERSALVTAKFAEAWQKKNNP